MVKKAFKKYVVIYLSQEHHEVLGYVMASDIKEATLLAKKELENCRNQRTERNNF